MILEQSGEALKLKDVPIPKPEPDQVLLKVIVCGICRTDLHVVDGELTEPSLPLIPGHQIVAEIVELGKDVLDFKVGQIVGVPWLGYSCGHCDYCAEQKENLCDAAKYTGYQINGGFAEYCVAHANYCFIIPAGYAPLQAAPLLCAGLIGYRAYRKIKQSKNIGLYGFGAAAHILLQVANFENKNIFTFSRKGDVESQSFALELGAAWAGESEQTPPELLDAAIIFAPAGELVPQALRMIRKGGTVVCAGIHMSDIPSFPYQILWGERTVCSIANLTRQDGTEFLELAPKIPVKTKVTEFRLEQANDALAALRAGVKGAVVLSI